MKKFLISTAFSLCALASIADTWGEAEAWVYTPKYPSYNANMVQEWAVSDSRGNKATLVYDSRSGKIDGQSLNQALEVLKLSVSSVFQNMAYLAQDIVVLNNNLAEMDKELQDLDAKLDNIFATIFSKFDTIEKTEKSADGSGVTASSYNVTAKDQTTIVIAGGVESLEVDNKSISTVVNGDKKAYQVKGYSPINGFIPMSTELSGLIWTQPKTWFDNSSIKVDVDILNKPFVGDGKHGVHLSGWYTHNNCAEKLSDRLTDGDETHYILTQKRGGSDDGDLHYMQIGKLGEIGGGGYAIKFQGTSGSPVVLGAPSSKTNSVTFASAADSNVSVTIGGNKDAVTVTIGVYYK